MRWIDVSVPLHAGMAVWPGDTEFEFEPAARIADGEICNVSKVTLSSHCGTHIDAPWHFEDNGKHLDEIAPAVFFGPARLYDFSGKHSIVADDFGTEKLPPRVLIKTSNSQRSLGDPFSEDYVALSEGAAQRLVDDGVRLVGVDYLSVAPFADPAPVHHILLRAEVLIVESLRLSDVPPGDYEFVVLPLAITGADGAPARAYLRSLSPVR